MIKRGGMLTVIRNIEKVKLENIRRIIDYIVDVDSFSKREISQRLNLSFTTASNIINLLESNQVVGSVVDQQMRSVGRSPKRYRMRKDSLFFLVVNFANRSLVTLALVDLRHIIVARQEFIIDDNADWALLALQLKTGYQALLENAGALDANVIAVGVSVQGSYSEERDVLTAVEQPVINGRHLRSDFAGIFKKGVVIQNDIDAAATYRARRTGNAFFVYIYLGYQIGAGIVVDGKLLNGYDGRTVEIAHLPIGDSETVCEGCGQKYCLETSMGKGALLEEYFGKKFPVRAEGYEEEWGTFLDAVYRGDVKAKRAVRAKAHLLAKLIIVLLSICRAPEVMISGIPRLLYDEMYPDVINMLRRWESLYALHEFRFDEDAEKTILIGTMDIAYQKWHPDFDNGKIWTDNMEEGLISDST